MTSTTDPYTKEALHPVVAIVQARMSSTRLPGKVMMELCGAPALARVVERLGACKKVDAVVVATSDDPSDDVIERWARSNGVKLFRGSLNDVLDRYLRAALRFGAATVVRITADCPLIDPVVVDLVVEKLIAGGYDYVSLGGEFPDGLDCEAFSMQTLKRAHAHSALASEREHVTPYIYNHPEAFNISTVKFKGGNGQMRWTVDDAKDFDLVTRIYEALYSKKRLFGSADILEFLKKNPELLRINSGTQRNEGYAKSLREDRIVKR